jgi:hypothetical protein
VAWPCHCPHVVRAPPAQGQCRPPAKLLSLRPSPSSFSSVWLPYAGPPLKSPPYHAILKEVSHRWCPPFLPQAPSYSSPEARKPSAPFFWPLVRARPPENPHHTRAVREHHQILVSAATRPSSTFLPCASPSHSPFPAAGPPHGRRWPPEHPVADRTPPHHHISTTHRW